jgi:hypothetical protein
MVLCFPLTKKSVLNEKSACCWSGEIFRITLRLRCPDIDAVRSGPGSAAVSGQALARAAVIASSGLGSNRLKPAPSNRFNSSAPCRSPCKSSYRAKWHSSSKH